MDNDYVVLNFLYRIKLAKDYDEDRQKQNQKVDSQVG